MTHPQFVRKRVNADSNAIICELDTILQTWYNQERAFKGTRVVVGSYGIVREDGTVDWKRGGEDIDNCFDICNKAILRQEVIDPETKKVSYDIVTLNLYTWLVDSNNNIYDVTRPDWTGDKEPVVINGIPPEVLERERNQVYKKFGIDEIEQSYVLKILEKIYRAADFSAQEVKL